LSHTIATISPALGTRGDDHPLETCESRAVTCDVRSPRVLLRANTLPSTAGTEDRCVDIIHVVWVSLFKRYNMNQEQQRKADSLRRVQDFIGANAEAVGALKDSEGSKQLNDAVDALINHGGNQAATDLALAGGISLQRALEAELRNSHMQPLATFARAKLRGAPDFAALVKSGRGLGPAQLVRAARAMATAAASQLDALTRAGFPADTITQLGAAAAALENAITERANAKVRRVGSTKGIREELLKGREAVAMLNAVVSKQFAGDKTFLAAWRAAHRVTAKLGVGRGAASAPVPAPVTVVAPAAPPAVGNVTQPEVQAAA
jgi:hypothetical protein